MKTISFKANEFDVCGIEAAMKLGRWTTQTDVIRHALRAYFASLKIDPKALVIATREREQAERDLKLKKGRRTGPL